MAKAKKVAKWKPAREDMDLDGGLVVVRGGERPGCLGFLVVHEGRSYDGEYGLVEVSAEEAEMHNSRLSAALVAGLDTCEVGQGNVFYVRPTNGGYTLMTWTGESVGACELGAGKILMVRNGRRFEGAWKSGDGQTFLERVA
jgi:hypothetical protein